MKKLLCLLAVLRATFAADVLLQWDANVEPDIAGYRIYCSTNGGGAFNVVATVRHPTTSCMVSNCVGGLVYTFYATAYGTTGLESAPSSSVLFSADPPTPPVITLQPLSQVAKYGSTVSFSGAASNVVFYQWYQSGFPISGATGKVYTTVATDTSAGSYMLRASNTNGSVFSQQAILSVTHVPPGQVKNFRK